MQYSSRASVIQGQNCLELFWWHVASLPPHLYFVTCPVHSAGDERWWTMWIDEGKDRPRKPFRSASDTQAVRLSVGL